MVRFERLCQSATNWLQCAAGNGDVAFMISQASVDGVPDASKTKDHLIRRKTCGHHGASRLTQSRGFTETTYSLCQFTEQHQLPCIAVDQHNVGENGVHPKGRVDHVSQWGFATREFFDFLLIQVRKLHHCRRQVMKALLFRVRQFCAKRKGAYRTPEMITRFGVKHVPFSRNLPECATRSLERQPACQTRWFCVTEGDCYGLVVGQIKQLAVPSFEHMNR